MTVNISTPPKETSTLTKNRIVAPIILGITIFLGIFVTRPLYITHIDRTANLSKLESDLSTLSKEYDTLLDIKNDTGSGKIDSNMVKKILQKFDRADLISTVMLNDFTKSNGGLDPRIAIGGINLGEPGRLPNGLSLSTVSVGVQGKTIDEIVNYITYLTTETPYAFTIENISLPIDTSPEGDIPDGYGMGLSFGVYTYEN